MRTITTTVYNYAELSPDAQAKARDWFREAFAGDDFYAENVIEDAADVAELMGLDIRQTRKPHADGSHHYAPTVYFSGFSSQGDGACCEGTWKAADVKPRKVQEHAPNDIELHAIAAEFERIAALCPSASFSVRHRGHYYHSGCTEFEFGELLVECDGKAARTVREWDALESDLKDNARRFMDWIYKQLENEYQNSDEIVAQNIIANEYEFTVEGARA